MGCLTTGGTFLARRWNRAGRPGRRAGLRKAFLLLAGASMATGALAGCTRAPKANNEASATTITLYSGQHEQTTQEIVSAFEQKTGIRVKVRFADEDTLADEIASESSKPICDVFYAENSPALEYLQSKGLLSHLGKSTLEKTPSRYSSTQGDWVGVSARVSVIVYNPRLIASSQLPTTALQMASPQYKGKLALAPTETDFQPIVTSVAHAYGSAATHKWLVGLKSNAASHLYPDDESIIEQVNRGAVAFGIVNQYYWYRLRAELGASRVAAKIAYFRPHDPGYVLDVSGAAVIGSSKHKTQASLLVAFLVSRQAQEIIAGRSLSFEYPLADGVSTAASEKPFASLEPSPVTVSQLGDGTAAVTLLRNAGLL